MVVGAARARARRPRRPRRGGGDARRGGPPRARARAREARAPEDVGENAASRAGRSSGRAEAGERAEHDEVRQRRVNMERACGCSSKWGFSRTPRDTESLIHTQHRGATPARGQTSGRAGTRSTTWAMLAVAQQGHGAPSQGAPAAARADSRRGRARAASRTAPARGHVPPVVDAALGRRRCCSASRSPRSSRRSGSASSRAQNVGRGRRALRGEPARRRAVRARHLGELQAGVLRSGRGCMVWSKAAVARYARSWLAVDLVSVVPFDVVALALASWA